ncbi:MAG TPA: cupin domain-containing protein [Gemmatimonadales bacterium]|nr:cupin domain-containing protein [Gemmatimonadales bacterium]
MSRFAREEDLAMSGAARWARIGRAIGLVLSASVAVAQGAPGQVGTHAVVVLPDQVTWGPAPPILPAGAKAAVLEGDPKQPGPFTMRVSFPDGYRIPPHFHPAHERVTVIQGTFRLGMGDKFDESALSSLPAGSYVSMQPGTHHFGQAQGATIIQVNGIGPWKLTYVNPADDPRKGTR